MQRGPTHAMEEWTASGSVNRPLLVGWTKGPITASSLALTLARMP